jgi:hypothetical protein
MSTLKTPLFALFFLFGTAALGQVAGYLSNEPQILQIPSHPQHAARQPMGQEQYLTETVNGYTYAKGERPLWDLLSAASVVPLGDVARTLRKEHASARKASFFWTN